MSSLTWAEAGVTGLLQGVTELFPVSSLGHSVLIPAMVGGRWAQDLDMSRSGSQYLSFVVALHVATAIGLIVYFRRDWVRLIGALFTTFRTRRIETGDQKLIWMVIAATIPVGLVGLAGDHFMRTHLAKPFPTAVLLIVNGAVLLAIEGLAARGGSRGGTHRAGPGAAPAPSVYVDERVSGPESDARLAHLGFGSAIAIGAAQILALAPGISRSGVTTAAGLGKGLSREDAARFAFLLATPVILAAGLLKLPELFVDGSGIWPQVLFGSVLSGVGAYLSVRFLTRYLATRTMRPFGIYCILAGSVALVWLGATAV
ncbi:undecaprenyl-diphosphate phosphatase [Tsukamurella sp. 8F]|uniref:undecaprenyl-diphosphate phosphatase n=1 Tax=unclassified Tsukamurella TaxID=2633480 RepID=UPI0023B9E39C|nr:MULTISPECIES: undecaprenyl-diphosphate phosphatase [unclassified Tsukamurella]MDF0529658.1 undecaprenyl-diphosphate phosphatase [Tsukamurella sp. 8J]MDF0585943.1 undecaprenyl-diphosphate phosphatase [Tsukamurella sp. 8F]